MSILVKKEIHLLRPVWLAVLVLEVALPWFSFGSDPSAVFGMAPVALFLGMILLAIEPFGREFSLGTFSSLMSQPMERRQVWQTKIKVLFLGAALIFAAYFVSCELRLHSALLENGVVEWRAAQLRIIWENSLFASVAVWFLALVGGLWTVLLLRQIATAFWITLLAPLGMLMTVALCLPAKYVDNDHVMIPLLYGLGALYTVAGFWLARRLFHQAQDAAWTGGVISFSTWRYFRAAATTQTMIRRWQPISALLKKEFQLHSISLFCALSLLVLHLLIFLLRITYVNFHRSSVAAGISDLFWSLWLVMPFIIGGTAVAEERKLGLTETQFCLPVSRRKQFTLKFVSVMIFGTLLGGVMPMLLESLAAWLHLPNDTFSQRHYLAGQSGPAGVIQYEAGIVALAAGLSWVSFFASTLARNFLQALSLTIVLLVAGCLCGSLLNYASGQPISILGILPWRSLPPILIGVPTLAVTLMWLLYRNFNWFHEGWRLWRRNLLGVVATVLFVFVSSALLYNRVWEVFQPAEPVHGPAIFSLASRPALRGDFSDNVLVRLPDGRMSFDSLSYSFLRDQKANRAKLFWRMLTDPRPASAGPPQFLEGSNWVSATAVRVDPTWNSYLLNGSGRALGYLDTVGIRADGTLWISSRAEPTAWTGAEMTQFGDETDWQQVVRQYGGSFLLLKNNGTLWRWGTNQLDWGQWQAHWPTVRNSPPHQIGTNSDWREIVDGGYANARRTDGSSWMVSLDFKTGRDKVEQKTDFDPIPVHAFSCAHDNETAYVARDGTLWISNRRARENDAWWEGAGFLQISPDTNWVAVAITWPALVALKADGSLWKWKPAQTSTEEFAKTPPTRLGIHDDWLALEETGSGLVTLAADGSLWLWSNDDLRPVMRLPKQPKYLGNVFSETQARQPAVVKDQTSTHLFDRRAAL